MIFTWFLQACNANEEIKGPQKKKASTGNENRFPYRLSDDGTFHSEWIARRCTCKHEQQQKKNQSFHGFLASFHFTSSGRRPPAEK